MAQSHREASRRLFEIAEQQQGFFTTKQAKAAGFAENTHPYHVQVGNWNREHRGIYRLSLFPTTDRPELVLWALWSRNRNEEVEGVYSHHTALSLYDLSDLNPSKLHMPISWKGTLQQYVGRLHRLHDNKRFVQVYDYVDNYVLMLARMYERRLKGYAAIGYVIEQETFPPHLPAAAWP